MVGVPTATTTTTITMHRSTASAIGMVVVTTGSLASAGMPVSAMALSTAHAGPAYSPYTSHALSSGSVWACLVHEAVGQHSSSTRIDPVGVFTEAWVGRSSRHANVGEHVYGAEQNGSEQNGYAGAGAHFKHTFVMA